MAIEEDEEDTGCGLNEEISGGDESLTISASTAEGEVT